MKLYEFTYNDNTNQTESEVLASAQEALEHEASLQGWAPGYNFRQCQKPKHLGNGEVEYYFEVDGEYLADGQSGENPEALKTSALGSDIAASP